MSISPLNGQDQLRAARALTAIRAASPSAIPSAAVRQSDSVEISDAARSLASARSAATRSPDVRAGRVAELKAAIANGTYTVDSRQLARSLIRAGAI
jgi:negative regulator of flagellin synthesis FlgM